MTRKMMHHWYKLFISLLLTYSPAVYAMSDSATAQLGKQLYTDNCAICHGHDGSGGVGIPLALESFLEQVPDEYLHRTIRVGRPGRVMPSFYRLSEAEIRAIIQHIRSWKKTDIPAWDGTRIRADAEQGRILYQRHCSSCHGKDALGGKGTGMMFSRPRDLAIAPPALNNQGFLNSASDAMLKTIITQGRRETPMPAASAFNLTEQDVDDLVTYIRSFQRTQMSGEQILDESPVLLYFSRYDFATTIDKIKRVILDKNYKLVRDQAVNHGFVNADDESTTQTMVYFCNYDMINDALLIDPRVGMFLPCRITVVEQEGRVQVMSINPKRLSQLFNNDELDRACDEMHKTYSTIIEEAIK